MLAKNSLVNVRQSMSIPYFKKAGKISCFYAARSSFHSALL
jgi:hypothetical protein